MLIFLFDGHNYRNILGSTSSKALNFCYGNFIANKTTWRPRETYINVFVCWP